MNDWQQHRQHLENQITPSSHRRAEEQVVISGRRLRVEVTSGRQKIWSEQVATTGRTRCIYLGDGWLGSGAGRDRILRISAPQYSSWITRETPSTRAIRLTFVLSTVTEEVETGIAMWRSVKRFRKNGIKFLVRPSLTERFWSCLCVWAFCRLDNLERRWHGDHKTSGTGAFQANTHSLIHHSPLTLRLWKSVGECV